MYLFLVQEVRGKEDLAPAGLRVSRLQLPLHLPALPRLQVCCTGIEEENRTCRPCFPVLTYFTMLLHNGGFCNNCTPKRCLHI
jgi:hypothetical protein